MQKDIISISINFSYPHVRTDYIFLSNHRRYLDLPENKRSKCIVTSNIPAEGVYLQTKYALLLNDVEAVRDNAGMMLIRFLINMGVKKILLAGMDGYSHEIEDNYADKEMALITRNAMLDAMNFGMTKMLNKFSSEIEIEFLTTKKIYFA